jgi:hypothetical protein
MNCPTCKSGRISSHTCGGQLEISNKARIQCKGCGNVSHVKYFNFSCSNHGNGYTDINSFSAALMTSFNARTRDESIIIEILQELRTNPW